MFFISSWRGDCKNCKKNSGCFFSKSSLSILRCRWTIRINLKIFLGCKINYPSIWPCMRHPWFPTRKASKLTFVCFQLHLFSTMQCRGWKIGASVKAEYWKSSASASAQLPTPCLKLSISYLKKPFSRSKKSPNVVAIWWMKFMSCTMTRFLSFPWQISLF